MRTMEVKLVVTVKVARSTKLTRSTQSIVRNWEVMSEGVIRKHTKYDVWEAMIKKESPAKMRA